MALLLKWQQIIESSKDWRAIAMLMERRWPEDWGGRSRVEMSGPAGGPIQSQSVGGQDINDAIEAELAKLLEMRLALDAAEKSNEGVKDV